MRGALLAIGIVLFVVGVGLLVGASAINAGAAACARQPDCVRNGGEAATQTLATGLGISAGLFALAGVGLGVAGIIMPDKTRTLVPTSGAQAARACPSCSAPLAHEARFCSQCGATIAPLR